jgi:3-oxoacyl-[acyl-carrier protein] reductase
MNNIIPPTVIIGGAGGIGSCLAARLRAAGAPVLILGRDPVRTEAAARIAGCDHATADARSLPSLRAAIATWGEPGAVVNLAGSILLKPAHLTSDEDFAETIALNLMTAFHAVQLAASVASCSSCVLMSSAAATIGLPNHEAIAAAKAGVEGLVRSAAATYAPRLRVNCVAPGLVETPLAVRITGSPTARAASERMHPLGRIGCADEIAAAIAWLLGPDSSWMTGQSLALDGGLSRVRRS